MEAELGRLKADVDRLPASITPVNRDLIDEKLIEIKRRRRELEGRREALASVAERDLDLEAATEAALGYLARFRDVVACGPPIERKEFVGAFVERIELWPEEKRGMLQMRDMVASSFKFIGWSWDELKKTPCPREWTLAFRDSRQGWRVAA